MDTTSAHSSSSSVDQSTQEETRLRATRACDFCKKRKVKCAFQKGKACFNCQAYNETCQFTSSIKKRGPQKGYVEDLEERIEQMEKIIQQASSCRNNNKRQKMTTVDIITPEIKKNKILTQRRYRKDTVTTSASKPVTNPTLFSNMFEEYSVLDPQQWPSAAATADSNTYYLGDLAAFQFFSDKLDFSNPSHNKNIWQGHSIRRFGDSVVLMTETKGSHPTKTPVAGRKKSPECKTQDARQEDIHGYIYKATGLDRYTAVRLLKIYFANVHPILPVIDKTEFLNQYRGRVTSLPSEELLNAMFGSAARFSECESLSESEKKSSLPSEAVWDVPAGWSNHFFDKAESLLSKQSNTAPTLSIIQTIILTLNYRGDRRAKSSLCWQLCGFAIRLAHLLGLHRTCEEWEIPRNEKETRKRVWWALYITDRLQTAILGRPIYLRDEDNNVPYPDAGADIEEVLDAYEVDKTKIQEKEVFSRFPSLSTPYDPTHNVEQDRPHVYELFIQFIKLAEILGRVLQGLHTPQAKKYSSKHGSDGLVSQLDRELTEWRYALPNVLKGIQVPDFNQDHGHFFVPVVSSMMLFYFSILIVLHQPFIQRNSTSSRSSYTSKQICTSAATRGTRIASSMTARDFLLCPCTLTHYPILQFGLIHMYNGKSPDPHVSIAAKLNLKHGSTLLKKLAKTSTTASALHRLFERIVSVAKLECTEEDEKTLNKLLTAGHVEKEIACCSNRMVEENVVVSDSPTIMNPIIDSIVFQQPISTLNQTSLHSVDVPANGSIASVDSRNSSFGNYGTQQEQHANCNVNTTMELQQQYPFMTNNEAFSLSQFGFNTTTVESDSLDYILQNINGCFFELPHQNYRYNDDSSSAASSQQQQQQPISSIEMNEALLTTTAEQQENIFRSNPNNVFWEIPHDIDDLFHWIDTL